MNWLGYAWRTSVHSLCPLRDKFAALCHPQDVYMYTYKRNGIAVQSQRLGRGIISVSPGVIAPAFRWFSPDAMGASATRVSSSQGAGASRRQFPGTRLRQI